MKLWYITQWGNSKDGPNGWDTNCVIASTDLKSAVEYAQVLFAALAPGYRDELADAAHLIGDDGRLDEDARLVIRPYIAFADNPGHYESWYRHPETNEWLDQKTMYGE